MINRTIIYKTLVTGYMGRLLTMLLLVLMFMASCTVNVYDKRLQTAAALSDSDPDSALVILEKIDKRGLSVSDRHLHDLLTVKSSDKAYITHKSDSLILDVIGYYGKHKEDSLYAEALYYGGRVYSDLGDYPTALRRYHEALDQLPEHTPYRRLRGNALSQTGRLLNTLRLYSEAIPHLSEVVEMDRQDKDSVNLVYDLQLLGAVYLHADSLDKASAVFREALDISSRSLPDYKLVLEMYLAAVDLHRGQPDGALVHINKALKGEDDAFTEMKLAYASQIYHECGLTDSAYNVANRLYETSSDLNYRKVALEILLSPELRTLHTGREQLDYVADFMDITEKYLDSHEAEQILLQNSAYNYSGHDRRRVSAETARDRYRDWLTGSLIVILGLVSILLFLVNRTQKQRIDVVRTRDSVNELEHILERYKRRAGDADPTPEGGHIDQIEEKLSLDTEDVGKRRESLQQELLSIFGNGDAIPPVDEVILCSETYGRLQRKINSGKIIRDNDPFWKDIEKMVMSSSDKFRERLQILTGGKLSDTDYHTALLIKAGVTPTQLTVLLNRTKGAISSRRKKFGIKAFDKELNNKVVDYIIRLI